MGSSRSARVDRSAGGRGRRRRGIAVPLIAISLVGLCGFVALAVDVGRMAMARDQCQIAADTAAMAGARALNGILPQDLNAASTQAASAASVLTVLGLPLSSTNVSSVHGTYRYDRTQQKFVPSFTLQTGESYNLTQSTVSYSCPTTFAAIFGFSAFNISATATAAHRPRDIAVVLDYSGSMNVESDLWNDWWPYDNGTSAPNNPNNTSNNCETVYPKFGHYTNEKNYSNYTNYANLLCPSADSGNALTGNTAIGKCNITIPALGVPAMVNDFWSNARGSSAVGAFTAVPDASLDAYNQAGGDHFLRKNNNTAGQPYAATVADINNGSTSTNSSWESNGYKSVTGSTLSGYIQGPRYWGKTFFIWPPDPTNDWRSKYFGTNDNTKLWDNGGNWRNPSGYYTINYKAILAWIQSAPNPFPATLRSGNILFYSAIPSDVPASAYTHTNPNSAITNQDQRFWKEYIDFVCGVWRDPQGNIDGPGFANYGPDYTYGTLRVSSPPGTPYMNYLDNPQRPRQRFWFGPMTMIQYMICAGILPGTAHDISTYAMKAGIGGALMDIQNNHPNDLVAMIPFNRPQHDNDPSGMGAFNLANSSLTNNYQTLINGLWIAPNSGTSDVRPWDTNGSQNPCAAGHFGNNTASQYAFMLAYNQLSSNSSLYNLDTGTTPGVGGQGRIGAQRMVIYETDGLACVTSTPGNSFVNGGADYSYYPILPGQPLSGSDNFDQNALMQVVQNICNNADGTPGTPGGYTPYTPNAGLPGYAQPGRPVLIHCLAFGMIFETPSTTQTSSVNLLTQISTIGGTTFPTSPADATNGYKWCIGTLSQRETKLRQAFTNIMNGGVPITLIK